MTHKQLIQKLIEHYQFGVDNLPMEDWDEFLLKNDLFSGICSCSKKRFDLEIYNSNWMRNLLNEKMFICRTPIYESREKALEYLQIRLNALKSIDLKTLKDE
jgi:hypothetical protein